MNVSNKTNMHMIINNSYMVPIYEQLMNQFKKAILQGELLTDTMLPSVRTLSNELKISALTVKKAYDCLEQEGFVVTVHGKGTFVASVNSGLLKEAREKEIQDDLERIIVKALQSGMSDGKIRDLVEIILQEI